MPECSNHHGDELAKVHLLKFMVNCFFSHFYQVCISKRFFHSRSSHFTFGNDCTVEDVNSVVLLQSFLSAALIYSNEAFAVCVSVWPESVFHTLLLELLFYLFI